MNIDLVCALGADRTKADADLLILEPKKEYTVERVDGGFRVYTLDGLYSETSETNDGTVLYRAKLENMGYNRVN